MITNTPKPSYYAVIFSSNRTESDIIKKIRIAKDYDFGL